MASELRMSAKGQKRTSEMSPQVSNLGHMRTRQVAGRLEYMPSVGARYHAIIFGLSAVFILPMPTNAQELTSDRLATEVGAYVRSVIKAEAIA